MLFSAVSEKFNQLSGTRKRLELTKILVDLLKEAGRDLRILTYLIQGKLGPDYLGIELGLADKLIITALSGISGKTEDEINNMFMKSGDLGSVAKEITAAKSQNSLFSHDLTVETVHSSLLKLASVKGEGSVKNKIRIFQDLLLNGTPDDAQYITRIATGKLRLGVSDATILDALVNAFSTAERSAEIEEAYSFHPDIGYVAELLSSGRESELINVGPEPMVPAKVMLAERLPDITQILQKMGGKAAFEYKYDGMRTQIHYYGGQVKIFSRGTEETTSNFPDIARSFKTTFSVESCILDGEAVPYNPETGELYPFQVVSQRRGRKYDLDRLEADVPLVVFLFDVIYLNGEPLHRKPYLERRRILEGLFTPNDSFRTATQIVSDNPEEVQKFFDESINSGCEGVVAKNVSEQSIYRAGARGWLWIKLKRDYQSEFEDSLDLTVIGAFGGHGRRKGTYGALLMATYNKVTDVFESICKLGTGFTDDVLFALPAKFKDHIVPDKPARVESLLQPDVWIEPYFVMEIIGSEITVSPVHSCAFGEIEKGAGLAIRFPRFTGKWREDKKPEDSTSTQEILEMFHDQKKRIKG
ncbi:MAG: ATP-dependent DNA ligase [Candidatus Thermoplasmatota archaeon]|nr:ATP-dependent DNA ligase [Candidatus Thermoplasmatota archaeon]